MSSLPLSLDLPATCLAIFVHHRFYLLASLSHLGEFFYSYSMPWYRHHYRDMALLIYLRFFVNIAQTALYSDINSHNTPFNMLRTTTSAFDASVSNLVLHICTGCVFVPSVFSRGQNGKVSFFLHTGSRNLLSGSVHISGI